MRILVIEDEPKLADYLKKGLSEQSHVVDLARDGVNGLHLALEGAYDLIVLDVMLPGVDGFGILAAVRAQKDTPILMLTALSETGSRITGLEAGADDYLPKPFDPRELILRINNILRRGAPTQPAKIEQIVFGPYTFVISRKELKRAGEVVRLTDREQDIMVIFAERAGETVPRHELTGQDGDVGERTIDVQINRLRRKIEQDPANPIWLQTVRGIGYKLSVE